MPCFCRSPPGDRSRCFPDRSCDRKYRRARWRAGSPRCSVVTPRFRDRGASGGGRLAGRLSLLNPQSAACFGSRRRTHRAGCPACSYTAGRGERLLPDRDNCSLAVTYFPVFWLLSPTALRSMQVRIHDKTSLATIGAALGVAAGLALTGCSGAASAAGGGHASSGASRTAGTAGHAGHGRDPAPSAPEPHAPPPDFAGHRRTLGLADRDCRRGRGAERRSPSPPPDRRRVGPPVPVPTRAPAAGATCAPSTVPTPPAGKSAWPCYPRRGRAGTLADQGRAGSCGRVLFPPAREAADEGGAVQVSAALVPLTRLFRWGVTRTRGPSAGADRTRGGCPTRRPAGRSR